MKSILHIVLLSLLVPVMASAQKKDRPVVQFSGFAMSQDSMTGIPFAHIGLRGSNRGGVARVDGFFSFAVNEGDTLYFTSLGYEPATYIVPSNVEDSKISTIILMRRAPFIGPLITVYYWGDRSNFPQAFRDARPPKDLEQRAMENTSNAILSALGEKLPIDGGEAAQRYMQVRAQQAYYYHQQAPQNIFNPLAWAEFIRALKNGDFKKKAEPQLPKNDY
ncbi:MAG: hypothetical protein JSS76_08205 [Bacteroidetes bacterium]|nr:hypothetical protein [Bacteroidota bacterium]